MMRAVIKIPMANPHKITLNFFRGIVKQVRSCEIIFTVLISVVEVEDDGS